MAYEQLTGPLGAERADYHTAQLASTIANAMRSRKRPYTVRDFMPPWGQGGRPEQSVEEQLAVVQALNKTMGGGDLRGHDR